MLAKIHRDITVISGYRIRRVRSSPSATVKPPSTPPSPGSEGAMAAVPAPRLPQWAPQDDLLLKNALEVSFFATIRCCCCCCGFIFFFHLFELGLCLIGRKSKYGNVHLSICLRNYGQVLLLILACVCVCNTFVRESSQSPVHA